MRTIQQLAVVAATAATISVVAQAVELEGGGRILNADGVWCWFTQGVEKRIGEFLVLEA